MKKILLVLSLAALIVSCDRDKKARISGTFAGLAHDTVLLEMITTLDRKIVDSAVTDRQGDYSFRVKLPVAAPTFFNLICKGSSIPLIVSPGERIEVNSLCDLSKNYTVEGSEDSEKLRAFNAFYNGALASLDSISQRFVATPATAENESLRAELLNSYTREYYRLKREHIGFIVSNPGSMAALYALYQRFPNDPNLFDERNDLVYYRIVADSLSALYPESPHVKALQGEIARKQEALDLAVRISERPESPYNYPEIELPDMYGKTRKLSELDGNVILIDFWTPADARSTILNAEMKELHDRFGGKGLAVYQVGFGDEKAIWIDAVQQQKLPWVCVFDPRGTAGVAAMSYNVQTVPSNVLLDRKGNIAGKDLYGDKLRDKIEQLLR